MILHGFRTDYFINSFSDGIFNSLSTKSTKERKALNVKERKNLFVFLRELRGYGTWRQRRHCILLSVVSLFFFFSGCTVIELSAPLKLSPADWTMFGKEYRHSHRDTESSFTFPLRVLWNYDASAGFGNGSPVVVDSVLFIGTLQGEMHAVNAISGKRIGYIKTGSALYGAPAAAETKLYFPAASGKSSVIALDLVNGKKLWTIGIGGVEASPVLFHGKLFAASLNGTLYCLDTLSGKTDWTFPTDDALHSSPAANDSLLFFGNDEGFVFAVNAFDGKLKWKYKTGAAVFGSPCVSSQRSFQYGIENGARGDMVFIGSRDHFLYAFDAATGEVKWKFDTGDRIMSCPSVNDSLVFVSSLNGTVSAVSINDGVLQWKFTNHSVINTTPVVTASAIFVGALDNYLYALSPRDGSVLWKYDIGSRIKTSPVAWRGKLYVAAEDKSVYCFVSSNQ